ncbi:MAG TPA: formyltetrahydrofolate deformylase [Solirubrobacteraceae bacterium]|nr:formyltetrahydrofolate deformylase [Solirubrobacteraceae bacterium]
MAGGSDSSDTGERLTATRLLTACPDRPGIVAAVSEFLSARGANIASSSQYSTDPDGGAFLMRIEFHLPLDAAQREELGTDFARDVAGPFAMEWRLWDAGRAKRVAILVSRQDHCVLDLLWRWRRGQLGAEIALVISNHPDLQADVEAFGAPFHHVPAPASGDREAEERMLALLQGVDVVVLARYMRILSGAFLERLRAPAINIHHSFLPAFAGAGAYEQARQRGVKLIGATAHYVTEELDDGPIIEQDVIRVSHRDSARALSHLGADIERAVLARAVRWHCEDRVFVHGRTTVVF